MHTIALMMHTEALMIAQKSPYDAQKRPCSSQKRPCDAWLRGLSCLSFLCGVLKPKVMNCAQVRDMNSEAVAVVGSRQPEDEPTAK